MAKPSQPWPLGLLSIGSVLVVAMGVLQPRALQATPLPPPSPLNPAWAFGPDAPTLPGSQPPALLMPGGNGMPGGKGGSVFNPAARNQPEAIHGPRPPIPACPLIVSVKDAPLQPLHLHPSQVALKNSFGCLSPSDAIYGPDGCPRRLCGNTKGYQVELR